MKLLFRKRGYPDKVIETEMEKVKFGRNRRSNNNKKKGVSLVLTYHPLLKNVLEEP